MTVTMLFDDWDSLGRILLVGTAAYVSLVAILRIFRQTDADKVQCIRFCRDRCTRLDARFC